MHVPRHPSHHRQSRRRTTRHSRFRPPEPQPLHRRASRWSPPRPARSPGHPPRSASSVNRGAKQVTSVTYALNGGDPLGAPAPTAVTKNSSTGSFTVTAANGQNSLTVTVTLTDGGATTSNEVTFTYTAVDYTAVRGGCQAFTGGVFTVGDDPGTGETGLFYCATASLPISFFYLSGAFGDACPGSKQDQQSGPECKRRLLLVLLKPA